MRPPLFVFSLLRRAYAMVLSVGFLFWTANSLTVKAEERFLLAADTQVIEVNRVGRVTDLLKHPRQNGIYDAWRLPDGGIAYAHRGGLIVVDASKKLVLDHPARPSDKGAEANSCTPLQSGDRFALMDSGVCQIRVVDRRGNVINEIPLPDLSGDALHFRYRIIRKARGGNAFWVGQYGRKKMLKVEAPGGRLLTSVALETFLKPSPAVQKCFSVTEADNGSLFVATSTGCQLLRLDEKGERLSCWTAQELGLSCRYLLGMQQLANGNLLIACGDYHLKSAEEGRDVLAEIDPSGKVAWRLTRAQLIDQVEGVMEGGLEELRITNVHAYDNKRLKDCLNVKR